MSECKCLISISQMVAPSKSILEINSHSLFNMMFPIPVLSYHHQMANKLSNSAKTRWQQFLEVANQIEQLGIKVIIVPTSFDYQNGVWWQDYPESYISEFNLNPEELPSINLMLKVDEHQKIIEEEPINISHNMIQDNYIGLRLQAIKLLTSMSSIKWSGNLSEAFMLHLK